MNWRSVAETVGAIAIVGSLIFVGLQLQQSQEIAIGSQYQERANTAIEMFSAQLENDIALALRGAQIREAFEISDRNDLIGGRSDVEIGVAWVSFQTFFTVYDNNHFQYSAGYLDYDSWMAFRQRMITVLSVPLNRAFYEDMKSGNLIRPAFVEVVETALN
jgi:hypothetical protein